MTYTDSSGSRTSSFPRVCRPGMKVFGARGCSSDSSIGGTTWSSTSIATQPGGMGDSDTSALTMRAWAYVYSARRRRHAYHHHRRGPRQRRHPRSRLPKRPQTRLSHPREAFRVPGHWHFVWPFANQVAHRRMRVLAFLPYSVQYSTFFPNGAAR